MLNNNIENVQIGNTDLEIFLENPYEGIVYIDLSGVIRYVNRSFAKYNKKDKEQIVGRLYRDFLDDDNLERILETQEYQPLTYYTTSNRKFIASRYPVYKNKKFLGVCVRYLSVDPKDIEAFGEGYADLIARLQTRDIMLNVNQSIMELNTYRDEFQRLNSINMGIDSIIGSTPGISKLKDAILTVSDSPSSVLITGESGTGKELIAKALHYHGNRSTESFIMVNCAAIPENLLESELFGYVDGAFTGARKGGKLGKFELANKGTIFLDEIGDMTLAMQAKLLRVLQERTIERLGSETIIPIDVRVISATNKDLLAMVRGGTFRDDLYYRLNIIGFHVPPLRERTNDIPDLVQYLINDLNTKLNRAVLKASPAVLDILMSYHWPGNIRELVNVLESTMNFCRSSVIEISDLPLFMHQLKDTQKNHVNMSLQDRIDISEEEQLISILNQCNGNRKAAAEKLNVSKSTLYRLMKKHDLL